MYKILKQLSIIIFNKIVNATAKVVRVLPVDSETIGSPRGFYSSVWEWIEKANLTGSEANNLYQKVCDTSSVVQSKPRTIDESIHWRFSLDRLEEFTTAFVAVVPNGRVWNNSAVITPDNKLLADVSKSNAKVKLELPKHHPIFREWKLPPIKYLSGKVAVLSVPGGNTYAHWLLDLLPRFHLLNRSSYPLSNIDYFVVNGTELPFQKETLSTIGIAEEKLIDGTRHTHIQAEQLIVPSLPRSTVNIVEWTPQWICNFLKQTFIPNEIESQRNNELEKIYISRAKASRRRVVNETQVVNLLERWGFREVFLESMTVAQQALLFASAKYIVAPHGAGLANLAFCHPGTRVIEIFPPNYLLTVYWVLSNQLEVEYYYLIGKGTRPTRESYKPKYAEDIEVDLESLSKLIECAEINFKQAV